MVCIPPNTHFCSYIFLFVEFGLLYIYSHKCACLGPQNGSQPPQHHRLALVRSLPDAREQADAVRDAHPAGRFPLPHPAVLKFPHYKYAFWVSAYLTVVYLERFL